MNVPRCADGMVSPVRRVPCAAAKRTFATERSTSASDSGSVLPSSSVSSRASSTRRRSMRSAALRTMSPRWGAGVRRHSWYAAAAASMACVTSAGVDTVISPRDSLVRAGLMSRTRSREVDSTHEPAM